VIRRLCWLVAGVLLGVTGYRRASRIARAIRPAAPIARLTRPAVHRRGAGDRRGIAPFARDVRDGMELYLDRHSGESGPTLRGQQVTPRRPGQAGMDGGHPDNDNDNAKDGR
jgi:hypothetical protein